MNWGIFKTSKERGLAKRWETHPFENLTWQPDRMLMDDLVFRLEHYRNDANWGLGEECFGFYKIKKLVDQYARFWTHWPGFRPRNVVELGIWDGGSIAFWFECLKLGKHVAIDSAHREDSEYFKRYVNSRGLEERIKTYWRTNQADGDRLREIVSHEFRDSLDLVIDDASHQYAPTLASFQALFPLLRPGGLYIIEDWAWEHWPDFHDSNHAWFNEPSLTKLVSELMEVTASKPDLVASLTVYEGFAVIERGELPTKEIGELKLHDQILRRPGPPRS
ncbi:MAG: class I SAM-dependent methyltransferase [Blastocatellia bacterium]